jgi:hypothetical protein
MVLTCTLAQAQAIRALLSTTAIALWVKNPVDTTKVDTVLLMDTRAGQMIITFTDESAKPTVAQVTAGFNNNAEVAYISPE